MTRPNGNADDSIVRVFAIRERAYAVRSEIHASLREIVDALHLERATGQLSINFSQGSVNTVSFVQREVLPLPTDFS